MKKIISFDALRGLAIIAVIAIHASNTGWTWYGKDTGVWNYYITLFLKQIYTFAVPSFFFMSGYFAVNNLSLIIEDRTAYILKKLKRILVPYFIWSFITIFILDRNYEIASFIEKIVLGQAQGPYYFLISLSCLICLTPLIIDIGINNRTSATVIFINFLSLVIIYYFRITRGSGFSWEKAALPFSTWIIFFYIGIASRIKNLSCLLPFACREHSGFIMIVATLIITELETFYLLHTFGPGSGADSSIKITSFIYSLSIINFFLMQKDKALNINKLVLKISDYSFGIYLIHMIILGPLSRRLCRLEFIYSIQPVCQMLEIIITLLICMSVIYCTRKILGQKLSTVLLGF